MGSLFLMAVRMHTSKKQIYIKKHTQELMAIDWPRAQRTEFIFGDVPINATREEVCEFYWLIERAVATIPQTRAL